MIRAMTWALFGAAIHASVIWALKPPTTGFVSVDVRETERGMYVAMRMNERPICHVYLGQSEVVALRWRLLGSL